MDKPKVNVEGDYTECEDLEVSFIGGYQPNSLPHSDLSNSHPSHL